MTMMPEMQVIAIGPDPIETALEGALALAKADELAAKAARDALMAEAALIHDMHRALFREQRGLIQGSPEWWEICYQMADLATEDDALTQVIILLERVYDV
jgi:hypothetical protein